jgi:molecular chaperone DnaK
MGHGVYGLGVDVGDATVVAAISLAGDEAEPPQVLPLDGAIPAMSATVRLDGLGRVHPLCDTEAGSPEGTVLAAHVLSRVGGPSPYCIGSATVPATEVLTAVVRWVCARATEQQGSRPASVALVVPPFWGEHRRTLLAAAVTRALDLPCAVVSSAEAVVRAHARSGRLSDGSVVGVYDLGASTLDTAVVGIAAGGATDHRTPPRQPLPWGGRDIDDAVLAHVLESLPPVHRARGSHLPAAVGRALRAHCVAAKESLSTETVVRLPIDLPDGPRSFLRLTRQELEELVAEPLADSVESLRDAVRDAGADVADLDAVVLSGGGARIPLVAEILSAHLERPVVVDDEPEFTAARGAALLALAVPATGEPVDDVRVSETAAQATAAPASGVGAAGHQPAQGRARPSAGVRRPPNPRQSAAAAGRRRRARQGIVVLGAVGTLLILPTARLGTMAGDSIGPLTDQRAQAAEDLPTAAGSAPPPAAAVPADAFAGVSAAGTAEITTPSPGGASSPRSDGAGAASGGTPAATPSAGPTTGATAGRAAADPAPPAPRGTPPLESPQDSGTQETAAPETAAPSTTTPPGSPLPPIPPTLPEGAEGADTTTTTDPAPPSDTTTEAAPPPDTGTDSPPPDTTAEAVPSAESTAETASEPNPAPQPVEPGPTEMV